MEKLFILLSLLSGLSGIPAWAGDDLAPPGADFPGLWQYLEQNNAELQAARLESSAADQRAAAAGVLPDPSLRIEWQDINQPGGVTLAPNQVGAVRYTWLQPIPGWGKLDAVKQTALAAARGVEAQQHIARASLQAQLRASFARYYRTYQAIRLNADLLTFATSASKLAQTRYEQGLSSQQEWITAQLEEAALQSESYALQAEYHRDQARLNALLNRPAGAELAAPQALPPLPAAAELEETQLLQRLDSSSPQLQQQLAVSAAMQGEAEMAARNRIPDFIVGVAPQQQGNGVSSWNAMLEFTIPLHEGSHSSHRHEAEQRVRASQEREQVLRQNLAADLGEHRAALQASSEQLQLIRQHNLPLVEMTYQSALAGYQNGRLDYATLWRAKREVQRTRLEEVDALASQQIHLAEIERLLGDAL